MYKSILISIFASLILCSCSDPNQQRIEDFPVFLKLNLTTQYPTFRYNVNDTLVFSKARVGHEYQDRLGYRGVLVTVGYGSNGTEYYAYELCCPYERDYAIRVYPNGAGSAICRKCKSEFYIADGWGRVSKGPSKWSLKRYHIRHINTGVEEYLIVEN